MIPAQYLLTTFAACGFLAVALGAFGAHGLSHVLDARASAWWQTAVQYQFYHTALGLILSWMCFSRSLAAPIVSKLQFAAIASLTGIVLFSGSLYIMALTGITKLGMVTPLGGLCFLIAWAVAAWQFFKINQ